MVVLKIHYKTKKLEKILTSDRLIKKEYNEIANKIMARISELRTAENLSKVSHLPPVRRHKLKGYRNRFAVDLSKKLSLSFLFNG